MHVTSTPHHLLGLRINSRRHAVQASSAERIREQDDTVLLTEQRTSFWKIRLGPSDVFVQEAADRDIEGAADWRRQRPAPHRTSATPRARFRLQMIDES
jgi:uncharacterized membrane-anchored protein